MTVRMRHTRSHSANRRSHHSLSAPAVSIDSEGVPHIRHRASTITGMYRGHRALNATKRAERTKRRHARLGLEEAPIQKEETVEHISDRHQHDHAEHTHAHHSEQVTKKHKTGKEEK